MTLKLAIILLSIGSLLSFFLSQKQPMLYQNPQFTTIRYVALGDSYTIGQGVSPAESWPVILTEHLQQNNIAIELVANPSRTGWTTQDVLDRELPLFEDLDPTFATLLIGVNDYVQGVDATTFRTRLAQIMDRVLAQLPRKENFIVITIPDYSVTPTGFQYSGPTTPADIDSFNQVIKDEAHIRNIPVVDIYALTQGMKDSPDLMAADGLHPSGKEYALWEELIYPVAYDILNVKEPH